MNVIHHALLDRRGNDGCTRQHVAGAALCRAPFEVDIHDLEAGATTGDATAASAGVVVLALTGSGKLLLDGDAQRFSAPCTLIVPAAAGYRIVNTATTPLRLVAMRPTPSSAEEGSR